MEGAVIGITSHVLPVFPSRKYPFWAMVEPPEPRGRLWENPTAGCRRILPSLLSQLQGQPHRFHGSLSHTPDDLVLQGESLL